MTLERPITKLFKLFFRPTYSHSHSLSMIVLQSVIKKTYVVTS